MGQLAARKQEPKGQNFLPSPALTEKQSVAVWLRKNGYGLSQ